MMQKTRAIVLRSYKYGESQLIVDMLTREQGRLSFICSVSKSPRAKFRHNFFQPLSLLEINFDYRERARLQRLKEVRIAIPYINIPFDAVKLSIAHFLAEFVVYATRSEQANLPLYSFVETSLQLLDQTNRSCANFHLVFMLRLTRFVGFFPNLSDAGSECFFDLRNACFVIEPPHHSEFLYPVEASKLGLMMRMRYETMHLFAMSRDERNRCVELILTFYRLHIPDFPEMKSWQVLKELFV